MTFSEVEKFIDLTHGKRIPQALNEMMWCEPLAEHINKKYSRTYNNVYKDALLDRAGIDIVMSEGLNHETKLLIQLTHAKEYDMSPDAIDKTVILSAKPLLDALEHKCTHYLKRGIDTHKLILIIQGILPESYIYELMNEESYRERFEKIECFDAVYYISDKVYPLKEIIL